MKRRMRLFDIPDLWFWPMVSISSRLSRLRCVISGGHRHAIVVENFFIADPPVMGPVWRWPNGEVMRPSQPVGSINGHLCERCHCHIVMARSPR